MRSLPLSLLQRGWPWRGLRRRGDGRPGFGATLAVSLAVVAVFASFAPTIAYSATVTISCGAVGRELQLCREGAEAWAARAGHDVRVVAGPNAANERLALYQQLFAARSSDIDVFQIDVIWPGALADHLADLRAHVPDWEANAHIPALLENNMVDGRLVALPWFADVGVLYYRVDLLAKHGANPPATWQELTELSRRIQAAERALGDERMWGFVFQGKAYEGLTCNALEWIASSGGGTIVDDAGTITIGNPRAVAAIALAAQWVGDVAPRGVLNYGEEEARGVFQSGHAVFMRNWPYAWALVNAPDSPVAGKVAVAPLPVGEPSRRPTGVLGGSQLAVSRYSRNGPIAADLVRYLAGAGEQRRRAIVGAFHPTILHLYDDDEVRRANPFFAALRPILEHATARPSRNLGARYNRVSSAFWTAVHETLARRGDAADNVSALDNRLRRMLRRR
ncbi:MAG TPA: ABC transporter substrate-binding protein [Alphaproteobacteria bacterium]|nr:ABC transporter substrate-binding protein [Alphaproteobacteria bacterium]